MPYKDVTYDNGFTERFYDNETLDQQALRMSRSNYVKKFPSADAITAARNNTKEMINSEDDIHTSSVTLYTTCASSGICSNI